MILLGKLLRKFFLFLICVFSFDSCLINLSGSSSETESGNEDDLVISLRGRVLNKEGQPVIGVVASLNKKGIADTTDVNGEYHVKATKKELSENLSTQKSDTSLDSLRFLSAGQIITSLDIFKWIDTLPDIFVVQRDISGSIKDSSNNISRVEAVLYDNDLLNEDPVVAEFFYNPATGLYSGFVYFVASPEKKHYTVYINVYDNGGKFIGRSDTLIFNSLAGDLVLSKIDPENAFPTALAMRDTTLSINDSLFITGTGFDPFDGKVVSYEWKLEGMDDFVEVNEGDTIIQLPDKADSNFLGIIRVTDDEGNQTLDSTSINIVVDPPVLSGADSGFVRIHSPYEFFVQVEQSFGEIEWIKWDFQGDGIIDDSSNQLDTIQFTYTSAGDFLAEVFVSDDDRNISKHVIVMKVMSSPPIISAVNSDTTISINDSIYFFATVSDSEGTIVKHNWDINNDDNPEFSSDSSSEFFYVFDSVGIYNVHYLVMDDDSLTADSIIAVEVVYDSPMVVAKGDTVISLNDTVTVSAAGSDKFGEIVKWEWKNGKDSEFIQVFNTDTFFVVPSKADSSYIIVVRATDDDGQMGLDTVHVVILQDLPSIISPLILEGFKKEEIKIEPVVKDSFGVVIKYFWDFDQDGIFEDTLNTTSITKIFDSIGTYTFTLGVLDDDKNLVLDTFEILIKNKAPLITEIRRDTIVSIDDIVEFHAITEDPDGGVVRYAWDYNGDGILDYESSTTANTIHRFRELGQYIAILTIWDAEGDKALDSLIVNVLKDIPIISVAGDTVVSISDTVWVSGVAIDHIGKVSKWEWDNGATGQYVLVSKADTFFQVPNIPNQNYKIVARVTDDDGNIVFDTVNVAIVLDVPSVLAFGDTTVSLNDTVSISYLTEDIFGDIVKIDYDNGGSGFYDLFQGSPIEIIMPSFPNAKHPLIVRVQDDDGNISKDTVYINVLKDPPQIQASGDTTVSVNDTVKVFGSGSDVFGSIIKWEWDNGGTGNFVQINNPNTNIIVPSFSNPKHKIILRATDDDGNQVNDTVVVGVLEDAPIPQASGDTTVSIKDTVHVNAIAHNNFGKIVKWEWDNGGTGIFTEVSSPDTFFLVSSIANLNYLIIVKVTDDDGLIGLDTVKVNVLKDSAIVALNVPSTIPVDTSFSLTSDVTQNFGTIEMYRWDFNGDVIWDDSGSTLDSLDYKYTSAGNYTIKLQVTDDDGNITLTSKPIVVTGP